jgi:death on curing protein
VTPVKMGQLDMRGLLAIHQELQARYGGGSAFSASVSSSELPGSRAVDMAKLELALLRAVKFAADGKRDMRARLAAGYAWALLKARPFAEGNERVALAAVVVCLEMSRLGWKCGEVEETAMVLRAAAGKLKEAEWEAWVVGHVRKKG